ncbi:MAG: hypothetical protein F6J97_03490 [Leptolyngbya sp. SIO4C1]|nr:hypothetical protein [Leptolyngbya sp. SIO4C1]
MLLVAIVNVGLALICLGGARRLWQLRRQLRQVEQQLSQTHAALQQQLPQTALTMTAGRVQIKTVQRQYWQWQLQRQRLYQLLRVLSRYRRLAQVGFKLVMRFQKESRQ